MSYIYTDEFNKVIKCAEEEMLVLKHPYVGSEHLLLAFLKEGNNSIIYKLNDIGITYDSFKSKLVEVIGLGNKHYDYILYTPLLNEIIDNAYCYSDNNFIDENNLFYSFCYSKEGIAKSILKLMNINIENLLKI